MVEMSLYMYSLWIAFATSLRKIDILESFSFILGKPQRINTRKGFVIYSRTSKEHLPSSQQRVYQPRSQGFPFLSLGRREKALAPGGSHDFQHPDIVGVINYNN